MLSVCNLLGPRTPWEAYCSTYMLISGSAEQVHSHQLNGESQASWSGRVVFANALVMLCTVTVKVVPLLMHLHWRLRYQLELHM